MFSSTNDMSSTFLYFAYGSNLLSTRLQERTPSARPVGIAKLHEHELRWHKEATDGSGKCGVVHIPNSTGHVLGVVYEIDRLEKAVLDAAETLGIGYDEREIEVDLLGNPVRAWAYFAIKINPRSVPFTWYKALVVAGAREHGLEAEYIQTLESAVAVPDFDETRDSHHRRLINGA